MTTDKAPESAEERRHNWQARLLPFMISVILFLALFFFVATLYQLYELNNRIEQAPGLQNSELLKSAESGSSLIERQWRTLVVLESHILQQRYHQAKVLLMARIWVQYLGFVTGMMLSLIGAVFILGKLREPTTELTLGGKTEREQLPGDFKMHLVTQSPGIVLVTLGTTLMLVSILVHHPIEVTDKPVYTSVTASGETAVKKTKPSELSLDSKSDDKETETFSTTLERVKKRHPVDMEEAGQ